MQADRSVRSVFVGNIPYDTTEEKLRDIFSAVGPVLSFRIVFDRETGKPKGYGFCEYKDQETATSAIRNLNGHDLGGRQLRVDSASNERARDEPTEVASAGAGDGQLQQQQQQLNQHLHQAPPVPEPLIDAQTLINNVMCNLQPEQLFDLCKQLKTSLLVNPNETRQLLVQNPQLSYALLQSLVMVKAIDAQTAMNTLHQQLMQPVSLQPALPMMAPMGPSMGQPPMGVPQPLAAPQPMVIQPQGMNPFPFVGPNNPPTMVGPSAAGLAAPQPQAQSAMQSVTMPVMTKGPSAASADPRLARQQQQQQQQQQQPLMSEQERQSFLMQVVSMTDQEISLLPPDQQEKIYLLRRQYMPAGLSQ